MKKTLVIFDLDGTLLYTLKDLMNSVNYSLAKFNYPQKNIGEIRDYVGNGVAKLIERAIPNGQNNIHYEECLNVFKIHYAESMYNNTQIYIGIEDLLKVLKSKGYLTAVVSNKFDLAVKELCDKFLPNLIDIALGENELEGIRKKPAPDSINKVLALFKIDKRDAIYVGDSEVDIMTAKNSGIDCISVTWGYKDRKFLIENGAKIIVNNVGEIYQYL